MTPAYLMYACNESSTSHSQNEIIKEQSIINSITWQKYGVHFMTPYVPSAKRLQKSRLLIEKQSSNSLIVPVF